MRVQENQPHRILNPLMKQLVRRLNIGARREEVASKSRLIALWPGRQNTADKRLVMVVALALNSQAVWAEDKTAMPAQSIEAGKAETPVQMAPMVIKGAASDVSDKPNIPDHVTDTSTVESLTAQQISESINAVTTGEVLEYLPSVHVRERYIGDINGILVMRVNSSIASAQTVVYADGMLLSNLLNNSYSTPPRWGMVSPSEIERVDVIYGPFSALYPGNSAGGIVNITTKMPDKLEFQGGVDYLQQHYSLFGTNSNYYGNHETVSAGDRVGDLSFLMALDHLDNIGQPMTFGATLVSAKATSAGAYVPVTGALSYISPANAATLVTSAIGIDHSIQDNARIKVAYDFTPTISATYTLGVWENNSNKMVNSYLTNAAGLTVYGGPVLINGAKYSVTAPSASTQVSQYYQNGLKVKSDTGGMFDWEVDASLFNEGTDIVRSSSGNTGTTPSAFATAGTIVIGDGTGWKNLDFRGDFRPGGDLKSIHQLSYGYHTDQYVLRSVTDSLVSGINWNSSPANAMTANSQGQTQTQALYLQDAWQMAPAWKLVGGGRMESWQATDGSNYTTATGNVTYQNRSMNAFSPKLALSYQATENWGVRSSFGTGTRFPTVGELFANVTPQSSAGTVLTALQISALPAPYNKPTNNPGLLPETVNSMELTAERHLENGIWRNSLFGEEKKNAIISTTDAISLPGYIISGNQNVDAVRTIGFETVLEAKNLWKHGFDFSGSATWVNSIITADAANPILVGTDQPRIPKFRATLTETYHQNDQLSYSVNYRYSGRQHVALYTAAGYTDPNPNVYGTTVSKYSVIDIKTLYKVDKQWLASFGINNLTNCQYFVNPNPYPMRTLFASLKYEM